MVYPNVAAMDNCQVAVATGLVDASQGGVPVQVFNPMGDPVTVYKGSRLAMFAPVEEDEVIDPEEVFATGGFRAPLDSFHSEARGRSGGPRSPRGSPWSSGDGVTAHLQDLLDRGAAHLGGEERARLASLLVEFQGAFTGLDGRLGQTK